MHRCRLAAGAIFTTGGSQHPDMRVVSNELSR